MKRRHLALGLGTVLVLGALGAGTASASPPQNYTCASGGTISAGVYKNVTVAGDCTFTGNRVTINGDLIVEPGVILNDHAASKTTVHINGNVYVRQGAVLGLGAYGPPGIKTKTRVNGDIIAMNPLSLYISGVTINGNVTSSGGVATTPGPLDAFRNFPFKDNRVNGNLTIVGWQGGWLGVIRDHVNGNVTVANNSSVLVLTPPGCDPELAPDKPGACTGSAADTDSDSTEVQTNVINGTLACFDNKPAAQVNANDGGLPNRVTGSKLGECANL